MRVLSFNRLFSTRTVVPLEYRSFPLTSPRGPAAADLLMVTAARSPRTTVVTHVSFFSSRENFQPSKFYTPTWSNFIFNFKLEPTTILMLTYVYLHSAFLLYLCLLFFFSGSLLFLPLPFPSRLDSRLRNEINEAR